MIALSALDVLLFLVLPFPLPARKAAPSGSDPSSLPVVPPPSAPPTLPPLMRAIPTDDVGRRLIREAATWIARGAPTGLAVRSGHMELHAQFQVEGQHKEGPMSMWWSPHSYRQQLILGGARTTRLLTKDGAWSAHFTTSPQFTREEETSEAVRQVRDDRERVGDVMLWLTLRGIDGPGVTFEFEGEKTASGIYARPGGGTWLKVVRKASGRPNLSFWFAHETDASGTLHATFPGVVRVAGSPAEAVATEDYVLLGWEDQPGDVARGHRFPRTIRALQTRPGGLPFEFLRATVLDLELDTDFPSNVFSTSEPWIARSR